MQRLWLTVCFLLSLNTMAAAGELLQNPGKAGSWELEMQAKTAARLTEDQGGLRFDVTRTDSTNWHIQSYQVVTGVCSKTPYTLRLTAKASSPRPLPLSFQLHVSPWNDVAGWRAPLSLTTEWKEFAVPVEFNGAEGKPVRIPMFVLGGATGTVWIKNVSVRDGSPDVPPPSAASPTNLFHDPMQPKSWVLETHSGAKATLTKSNEDLTLDIAQAGTANWHVQMYMVPAELKMPGNYTLSIAMRADTPRKVPFLVSQNVAPYGGMLPLTVIPIDTQWKLYVIRFRLDQIVPGATRIPVFQLGSTTGTIGFRSFTLTGPDSTRTK